MGAAAEQTALSAWVKWHPHANSFFKFYMYENHGLTKQNRERKHETPLRALTVAVFKRRQGRRNQIFMPGQNHNL